MTIVRLDGETLKSYCVSDADSVRGAMGQMNRTGHTLLLVVKEDSPGRLIGVVSDGDIRRHLAADRAMDAAVTAAMNSSPTVLDADAKLADLRSALADRGLAGIPLVKHGELIAFAVDGHKPQPDQMSVVIMAGGLGTRLAPLTDSCPKPLLQLGGKPILTHVLEGISAGGFTNVIVSVNYLGQQIVNHYQDGAAWDVRIDYVHETERLGTGGALALVDPSLLTENIAVVNGDLLHDIDLAAVEELHREKGWEATMVVRPHYLALDYGVVDVKRDGSFERIREKPTEERMINAGVYVLSKSAVASIPEGQYFDLPSLFTNLAAEDRPCGTFRHDGRWIDIGTIDEFERARAIFADSHYGVRGELQ